MHAGARETFVTVLMSNGNANQSVKWSGSCMYPLLAINAYLSYRIEKNIVSIIAANNKVDYFD